MWIYQDLNLLASLSNLQFANHIFTVRALEPKILQLIKYQPTRKYFDLLLLFSYLFWIRPTSAL